MTPASTHPAVQQAPPQKTLLWGRLFAGLLLVGLATSVASAQAVAVQLPDVSGPVGAEVHVDVRVDDLTGRGASGYEFSLRYDPAVVRGVGVVTDGTLTGGGRLVIPNPAGGDFRLAVAGTAPFEGDGVLVRLVFEVLQAGTSALEWDTSDSNGGFSFDVGSLDIDLTDSGTVTGTTGVDVVLDGGVGWYHLAAPVGGATVGDLFGSIWTQGYDGSGNPAGDPTVLTYDETATGVANNGFGSVASSTTAVPSGTGLFVYVFADDDPSTGAVDGGFPKTLSLIGASPDLPFAFPGLTYTSTGSAPNDGWVLLGNPVQDPIDWDASEWTKTNVADAVYVWSPADDAYLVFSAGAGSLTGGEIPPARGFWVQTTGAGPAVEAPAVARVSARTGGTGGALADGGDETGVPEARTAEAKPVVLELRLTGTTDRGERASSAFVVLDVEGASAGADRSDAYALVPPSTTYVLAGLRRDDGEALAVSAMPALADLDEGAGGAGVIEVPLAVEHAGLAASGLEIRWPQVPEVGGWQVSLVDRATDAEVDLSEADVYAFDAPEGRSAAAPEAATDDALQGPDGVLGPPGGPAPARMSTVGAAVPVPLVLTASGDGTAGARGTSDRFAIRFTRDQAVATEGLPTEFAVRRPAPNPTSGRLGLGVELPLGSEVSAQVFDLLGRRVLALEPGERPAGRHGFALDARGLAPGVYVVRTTLRPASGDARVFTHKITVIR